MLKRVLIFLFVVIVQVSNGAVTVGTATGGDAISADDKGVVYTTLGGPIITETANGEVGVGTIILNAPTGCLFDVGGTAPTVRMDRIGGAGVVTRNINGAVDGSSLAITSRSTTQIVFTVTSASNAGVFCKLTWQNVRVTPNSGAAGAGNITSSGTSTITGVTSGSTNFGTLTVIPGAFTKMQLLVPGETAAPGTASGKTGTPTAQTAGSVFSITVNAVDANWNVVSTTNTIDITSSDGNATLPASAALVNGTKTFGIILKTSGSKTITASNYTDPSKNSSTSPSITVNAGAFTKLQLIMPGESASPGSSTGKTGTPSTQTAGTFFSVTVNAVDDCWNIVSSTNTVGITSTDVNATMPSNSAMVAGSQTFNITFKTAGTATITATNITDGTKTASTSPSITVSAGAFSKMQILVPGETASPGTTTGKTGTAESQSIGIAFSVTVNAVDANWNVVSSTNTIDITSTDGTFTDPPNNALVGGSQNFNVTLNSAGVFTVTASNVTDPSKTANTSYNISVVLSVLTTATGGSSIPATNTGGSYTTLTNPSFTEGSSGDVGVGTIILNAPSGVIFDVVGTAPTLLMERVGGAGANALNINGLASGATIAVTSRTTTQIVFTITSASSSGVTCKLTYQNIRVRPSTGAAGSGNLTKTGTSVLTGVNNGTTNFGTLTVVAGTFTKMQLLVPGETAAPGTASGKTGTPTNQTAGTVFNVTVNAVDDYWNVVNTTNTIGLTSSDANATLPSNTALVAGTISLSTVLNTTGSRTLTATNITDGTKTANTSPSITVNTGTFTKLQILLPGETAAPGTSTGKTGTPTSQTAGTAFNVTVNAVDAVWNIVSSTNTVGLTSSDANESLPANTALVAGSVVLSVTLKTAGVSTITSTNITDGTKAANTSSSVTVNPGVFTKLQVLVPGETASPGSITGKTGAADAQSSTRAFTFTVNAVDANWNKVTSGTSTIAITSSDGTAILPANAALVGGTKTFNLTFNATSGNHTITASDVAALVTSNTSSSILITLSTLDLATGGSAISADNTGGAYTALTGPVYTEGTNGDVGLGTIILNAPSGCIFDVGGTAPTLLMTRIAGGGGDVRNINGLATGSAIALTSITTTKITFNITSVSNGGVTCRLTFQNVRVRPATGLAGSGNLTKSGTSVMVGVSTSTNLGTLTVIPGAFNKMQLLVSGETAAAGTVSGKTGTPLAQTAGTAFNLTVNAVDTYWNLVNTVTNVAGITSSDANATLPANAALVGGTQTFSITLKTSGSRTITASNITDPTKTANTSPSITVNTAAFSKMQLIVPGETVAPGTATGKTGTPTAQTAGTAFNVTVNAVDAYWNLVNTVTNAASITTTDVNATLPSNAALVAGTNTFSITLKTAGAKTITATNVTDGTKTANTSPSITVNPGAFTKMQILVPGETANPGSATGKTGTANVEGVPIPFLLRVNAVDAYWNVVSSTNVVGITSTDASATLPSNAALVAGTQNFYITFNTVGFWTVTATNITDGTKTANTSPLINAISNLWTWTGAISNDWFTAGNWDAGSVPNATSSVLIPGGTPFEPTITGAFGYCSTLYINSGNGGRLTINYTGGGKLIK